MKCPKCGYVGFESADKCRNCGYHFSLVENPPELDLTLDAEAPLAAPADLDLQKIDTPPEEGKSRVAPARIDAQPAVRTPRVNAASARAEDLPLFDGNAPAPTPEAGTVDVRAMTDAPRRKLVADTPGSGRNPVPPPGGPRMRPRNEAQYRPAALALEPDPSPDVIPPRRRGPASGPRPAGSAARIIAGLLDGLILGGLDLIVLYFTLRVCRLSFADVAQLPPAPLVGFFLLLDGAYLVAFTANGGQTIGKMAAGIRVVGDDGNPVIATQSMVRAAGYLASMLPAGLGFVPGLFGPARRALHDRLANTRVIKA